jgi:hypothetical protein
MASATVALRDVPRAWDVLAALYMWRGLEYGVKACVNDERPEAVRGRELTVYMFRHDPYYDSGMEYSGEDGVRRAVRFPRSDERSSEYWWGFVHEAERLLAEAGVESRGCADGDLALGGRYASLRNEAYVLVRHASGATELAYPPNGHGWNAARHAVPMRVASEAGNSRRRCVLGAVAGVLALAGAAGLVLWLVEGSRFW